MKQGVEIEIIAGPTVGKRYIFHKKSMVVGRGRQADLSLDEDRKVSRQHLCVTPKRGHRFELVDMSSRGTFVAGVPVVKDVFPMGTEIGLGDSSIRVGANQAAPPSPEAPERPSRRRGIMGAIFVVAALMALSRLMNQGEGPGPASEMSISGITSLMNDGQWDRAISDLEQYIQMPPKAGMEEEYQEYYDLYHFAVRLNRRRKVAENFERRLLYDSARDQWEMIRSELSDEWLVLKDWIDTRHIQPLRARLREYDDRP